MIPHSRRFATSNIPDGKYSIRLRFDGIANERYELTLEDRQCVILIPYPDKGSITLGRILLDPRAVVPSSDPAFDYEISSELPTPYHSLRSNENLLLNLTPFRIIRRPGLFGYSVNNREYMIHESQEARWLHFSGFLKDYLVQRLGLQWLLNEEEKRLHLQHPFARLHNLLQRKIAVAPQRTDGSRTVQVHNGIAAWFLDLSYNLFWIDNNDGVQEELLKRLRSSEQFWSTVHEIFVASIFARAGFSLAFEDELDRTQKHPEFIATHRRTGEVVTVEAKAISRQQIAEFRFSDWQVDGLKPGRLLNDAFKKIKQHAHFVVLDTSLPPQLTEDAQTRFNDRIVKILDNLHPRASRKNADAWNTVYFVNRPFLFSEGTDQPTFFSLSNAWTRFPKNPHPSLFIAAALGESLLSIGSAVREIDEITARIISTMQR